MSAPGPTPTLPALTPPSAGGPAPEPRRSLMAAPPRRPTGVSAFQADALALEEQAPPGVAGWTLYAVAAFLAGAVLWASVSPVDEIVVAPGRLVPTAPNLVVQPLETSIIRSIEVAVGDHVPAGAVLATLDPTFTAADVAQLRERLDSDTAQIARLEAEQAGQAYGVPATGSPDEALQAALYQQRQAHHQAQLRAFDDRIATLEASLATNRQDQAGLSARLAVLREVETMREALLATQTGSRLNLLEARSARLEAERNLALLASTLVERSHELDTARAERAAFVEEVRQTRLEELVELRRERDSVAEQLAKAERRRQLVALTAPAEAVVLEVAERSIGSVLREAEPLVTLVPVAAPVEAEVSIAARDIGQVAAGDTVRVKLDAFPFQKHGTARGLVRTLSADAFADEAAAGGGAFYRARVQLTDTALRAVPDHFRLIPGMTVVAEIKVGQRRVLSYFLYPLLRGLDESLREP